ncbi:MAG: Formiminoglutamic iminohydrolase [Verrucomicrobia bacterium]|nr:Formiminoglutamic iminohydrolase [Verrucomicrobiota bacterium]
MPPEEKSWRPDLLFIGERFERDLAMVADAAGRIVRFSREPRDLAKAERLHGRAILPGFVNAHSHAFQRVIRGRTEHRSNLSRDTFWTWREKMYHAARSLDAEGIHAAARMVFLEMALAGITTVGEFHYLHHQPDGRRHDDPNLLAKTVVCAAREVGLRIALLHCGYARAGWRQPPHAGQARFLYRTVEEFCGDADALGRDLGESHRADEVWTGLAPHSLRAVSFSDFREIAAHGRSRGLRVHMHVSEQRAENEACLAENGRTPVALLAASGWLDENFTAIHAVHLTSGEAQALGAARSTVCACPTTERNLGDGLVPAERLLEAGAFVALGSDSQIQIGPLEDARELESNLRLKYEERIILAPRDAAATEDPDVLARRLFSCATSAGARSLGAPGGSLAIGRPADFFTVDLRDPSIAGAGASLAAMVFSLERTAIRDVVVGGKKVIADGRHALQGEITDRFVELQRRLWGEG